MKRPRLLLSACLVGLAPLLGVTACKPSTSTPDDTTAPAAKASASDRVSAAVDAINPITSAREDVIASMRKLMEASSYHVSMDVDGGAQGRLRNEVDFVAPDRMRMEMAGLGTQVVVGETMYMTMDGRAMQVPMPKGSLTKWRDPANFGEAEAGMTAEALGRESVDGIPARKYALRYTVPNAADGTLWIGPDGLPLKIEVASEADGKQVTTSMRYSRINDPSIRIEAPK